MTQQKVTGWDDVEEPKGINFLRWNDYNDGDTVVLLDCGPERFGDDVESEHNPIVEFDAEQPDGTEVCVPVTSKYLASTLKGIATRYGEGTIEGLSVKLEVRGKGTDRGYIVEVRDGDSWVTPV